MKKKREPRVGPSGPVFGLASAMNEAPNAPPANLAELLKQHRKAKGKDKAVEKALLDAFAYMAYRKYTEALEQSEKDADDLLGESFRDLGVCVERLAKNQIPAGEVESYIRNELYHSRDHIVMEDTISLAPPSSTVADRKKKGLPPLSEPERVRRLRPNRWEPNPEFPTSPLHDPECRHVVQPEYGKARVPSRFDQPPVGKDFDEEDSYAFLVDVLVKAAETPLEKTVAGMLLTGHSGNAISQSLKVPRKQITNIIRVLRSRVWRRLNGEKDEVAVLAKALSSLWSEQPAPDGAIGLPVSCPARAPVGYEEMWQVVWPTAV